VPQFDQEFIEKVRTAVDIVEVIGQDVKLTQRGRNYVGLCPFHDEKTDLPSLSAVTINCTTASVVAVAVMFTITWSTPGK